MKVDMLELAKIGFAIMPLVDVGKKVIREKFGKELDYTGTLALVLLTSVVLGLSHTYYPLLPMPLQVIAGTLIIGLDAAGVVKLVFKKDGVAPKA